MVQTRKLREDLYCFEDGHVRQFLFVGADKALLLDTGYGAQPLLPAIRALTSAPVQVVLTHADPDHAGGLGEFEEAWLHEADWPLVHSHTRLHPLREGDVFVCGDYRLEVIEIPGHTGGSVALADRAKRLLFAGDSVQKDGPIYLFGSHRCVSRYIESQRKLAAMAGDFDWVFPCHHDCPIGPQYIDGDLQDALAMQAGQLPATPETGMPCFTYRGRWTAFYCTPEDLRR